MEVVIWCNEIFKSVVDRNGEDDSCVNWKMGSIRNYTVKDGYSLVYQWRRMGDHDQGEPSNIEEVRKIWRVFWRLRLPDIVKIQSWKIFIMPFQSFHNLQRKGCNGL